MSSPSPGRLLPRLGVADFQPGADHVSEAFQNGRVFAIVHKDDPVRQLLANLPLDPNDLHTYLFVHGGQETTRFENMQVGTHEIPDHVIARLLENHYGRMLDGMGIRLCTCYGNMLRPGDPRTAAQGLAGLLPKTRFEAYHGLVHVDPNTSPPRLVLGDSLGWDPTSGPYYAGPPGNWEPVQP
jgi:hypothetical protein